MINKNKLFASFLFGCGFVALSNSQPANAQTKFDIDNDGLSDIVHISIDNNENLDWQVLTSTSAYQSSISSLANFGENGAAVAAADWEGDGDGVNLGYIDRNGSNLRHFVRIGATTEEVAALNIPATIVSGMNVDGGGADLAVIKPSGDIRVYFNRFGGGAESTFDFNLPRKWTRKILGKRSTATFFSNSEGTRLGVVYRPQGNASRYRIGTNNFADGSRENIVLKAAPRGQLIEAVEILNGQGVVHLLLHEKINNSLASVRIFDLEGELVFSESAAGSAVLVGNYSSGATGEQFLIQNGTSLRITSPFGGPAASTITVPSGVVADLANVNSVGKSSGGGGGGGSNPGLSSVCKSFSSFAPGRLWKPSADASDARQGKPVVLFTGSNKTSKSPLRIYDSEGNDVCPGGFTFKSSSIPGVNGGADHYFAGWSEGCGLSSSQIAARAQANTKSRQVYVSWKNNTCLSVPEPNNRYGGV